MKATFKVILAIIETPIRIALLVLGIILGVSGAGAFIGLDAENCIGPAVGGSAITLCLGCAAIGTAFAPSLLLRRQGFKTLMTIIFGLAFSIGWFVGSALLAGIICTSLFDIEGRIGLLIFFAVFIIILMLVYVLSVGIKRFASNFGLVNFKEQDNIFSRLDKKNDSPQKANDI